jgi:hypothetical protein
VLGTSPSLASSIRATVVATSTDLRTSTVVNFPFSTIISGLSQLSCGASKVTSLANQKFYLRTFLTTDIALCGGTETTFTSSDAPEWVMSSCGTNPDFVQWANISCDISCVCTIQANGRRGNHGSNQIVGAGAGCQGSWQITNGWVAGGVFQQILLFGMVMPGGNTLFFFEYPDFLIYCKKIHFTHEFCSSKIE